jgi:hypothetical protein
MANGTVWLATFSKRRPTIRRLGSAENAGKSQLDFTSYRRLIRLLGGRRADLPWRNGRGVKALSCSRKLKIFGCKWKPSAT